VILEVFMFDYAISVLKSRQEELLREKVGDGSVSEVNLGLIMARESRILELSDVIELLSGLSSDICEDLEGKDD
jgi:hypothetical protein